MLVRYGLVARIHRSHASADVAGVRFPVTEFLFESEVLRGVGAWVCVVSEGEFLSSIIQPHQTSW
jgi:hypothetical protein